MLDVCVCVGGGLDTSRADKIAVRYQDGLNVTERQRRLIKSVIAQRAMAHRGHI